MRCLLDIETESLTPEVLHCIVTKEEGSKYCIIWTPFSFELFKEYSKTVTVWIAHNGLHFDIPNLNKLLSLSISLQSVIDTIVVSRLVNYSRYSTHSLEELGLSLGYPKINFNDYSKLTQEMLDYCVQDVLILEAIYNKYKKYILDPAWKRSLRCEHDITIICDDMQHNGFYFNKDLATQVLINIQKRMAELEEQFQKIWPPELIEVDRKNFKLKADGTPHAHILKAYKFYPKTKLMGTELVCYDYKTFNPGSTKDRIEKLHELGWKPVEKSDTHYKFSIKAKVGQPWGKKVLTKEEYDKKKEYFNYYGWKVSEENLETLPSDAPEIASALAEWLTLNGRGLALEERIRLLSADYRLRTTFWHIGAWTHRMAHTKPNLANISSPFHGEPKSAVQRVKAQYDVDMRRMFAVESGYLVGTDAESIQLRVLAHYLRNDDYVHAIISGRKEDQSDIHNVNRRSLKLDHLTRDHAKTFIYAWLLGAGTGKVSRILGCSTVVAKGAVEDFIANTEGLGELKRGRINRDARRGYFEGFDGRKVLCNDAYLMLAGYLQNGESVIMKHSNILWRQWADEEKINYKQVNFVHDEWQTQVYGSYDAACRLGELQCKSFEEVGKRLGVYCPLSGETKIGHNWYDTH